MVDGSRDSAEVRVNELAWIRAAASRVQEARVCLLAEIVAAPRRVSLCEQSRKQPDCRTNRCDCFCASPRPVSTEGKGDLSWPIGFSYSELPSASSLSHLPALRCHHRR